MAADAGGAQHFDGGGAITAGPQTVAFIAPPGRLEVRLGVESAEDGETIDREVVALEVPDLAAPSIGLSTPRVFAARTGNEFRAASTDAAATPTPRREFSKSERLLIRFDAYTADPAAAQVTAAVVNRLGDRLATLPVAPAAAGGTHQVVLPLGGLAPGEYAIEITARTGDASATELVPLRVAK